MNLKPGTVEDLASAIANARQPIARVDLSELHSILEHAPEDMTATVQCGLTLGAFQAALARHGQWIPIDPAHANQLTIGELLAQDLNGPRRLGYGTIREYVIGMRVVLGNGEIIRNGGKVVKNVAGYDLCRLFIGARNTLGIIVEATFKLRPLPEKEAILSTACQTLADARSIAETLSDPVVLDLHNVNGTLTLVAAFAGSIEDVQAQEKKARAAGLLDPGTTAYDTSAREMRKMSLLPSTLWPALESLGHTRFIARVGNGIVYHTGPARPPGDLPRELMARVKKTYDPNNILPEFSV